MTEQERIAYNALPESLKAQLMEAADIIAESVQPPAPSLEEARRLRGYFPFRYIWAFWTAADGWQWQASTSRRAMIAKARKGIPVVEAQ